MTAPSIVVRDLRFGYRRSPRPVLDGIDLEIAAGTRTLLIGANGAGKTTLLRVLAGKHMVAREAVEVAGGSPFHDPWLAARVEFLGGVFGFDVDLRVGEILERLTGVDPARLARLEALLGVDRDWHMHAVSDGQRRRVQLLLGLVRGHDVLLLDEVTTDLDLVARGDLLAFLHDESTRTGTTIVYATHILDVVEEWASHLVYMVRGRIRLQVAIDQLDELPALRAAHKGSALVHLVDGWLRRDRE